MATCTSTPVYTNIVDLPLVTNIEAGDFLIVQTPEGTSIIDFNDFIITPDNTTFGNILSAAENAGEIFSLIDELSSQIQITVNPEVANLRISLSPNAPVATSNLSGVSASSLYVHPYKGNNVSLYSVEEKVWKSYILPSPITVNLNQLVNSNTCFDVYLAFINNGFEVTFKTWPNSNAGDITLTRQYIDGVAVDPFDNRRRLIGCIRTTNEGASEFTTGANAPQGASPKLFVWNAQNKVPVSPWNFDTGTWYLTGNAPGNYTGWGRLNRESYNNRLSFLVGEPTEVSMTIHTYFSGGPGTVSTDLLKGLVAVGINDETGTPTLSTGGFILGQVQGSEGSPQCTVRKTFNPGFHYIQLVENYFTGGSNKAVVVGRGEYNKTGFVATMLM